MRRHPLVASLLLLALASNAAAWRARIAGDAGWSASIQSLGVFANGDVAAIGSVQHASTVDDFLVMRFQARTGRVLWQLALDGATGVERWRLRLGRDLLTTLVRGDHGLIVGGGITNDDDLDPFEGVVVSRDGRRGTDAQGSKAHGAHGHVPPGHRVP